MNNRHRYEQNQKLAKKISNKYKNRRKGESKDGFSSSIKKYKKEIIGGIAAISVVGGFFYGCSTFVPPGDLRIEEKRGYVHVNQTPGKFLGKKSDKIDEKYKIFGTFNGQTFNDAKNQCKIEGHIFDDIEKKLNGNEYNLSETLYFACDNSDFTIDSHEKGLVSSFDDSRVAPIFTNK